MRRLIICAVLVVSVKMSLAQDVKLGIQLSPAISVDRYDLNSATSTIDRGSSAFKLRFGAIADFSLTDTYFVTTGLIYAPKEVEFTYNSLGTPLFTEGVKLQYLQVPIALKMFTNEIMLDTKIYVKMGVMAEFKIGEKQIGVNTLTNSEFRFFDTSLLLGAGVEYAIGTNTIVFAGLSYNRGLININPNNYNIGGNVEKLKIHNDLFNLDLGVKF